MNKINIKLDGYPFPYVHCLHITMARSHNALHNRLWHHHQNINRANVTQIWCAKIALLIINYRHNISQKKETNSYLLLVKKHQIKLWWTQMIFYDSPYFISYIDGLVHERHNSSALAVELCLFCINWLIYTIAKVGMILQNGHTFIATTVILVTDL